MNLGIDWVVKMGQKQTKNHGTEESWYLDSEMCKCSDDECRVLVHYGPAFIDSLSEDSEESSCIIIVSKVVKVQLSLGFSILIVSDGTVW